MSLSPDLTRDCNSLLNLLCRTCGNVNSKFPLNFFSYLPEFEFFSPYLTKCNFSLYAAEQTILFSFFADHYFITQRILHHYAPQMALVYIYVGQVSNEGAHGTIYHASAQILLSSIGLFHLLWAL